MVLVGAHGGNCALADSSHQYFSQPNISLFMHDSAPGGTVPFGRRLNASWNWNYHRYVLVEVDGRRVGQAPQGVCCRFRSKRQLREQTCKIIIAEVRPSRGSGWRMLQPEALGRFLTGESQMGDGIVVFSIRRESGTTITHLRSFFPHSSFSISISISISILLSCSIFVELHPFRSYRD